MYYLPHIQVEKEALFRRLIPVPHANDPALTVLILLHKKLKQLKLDFDNNNDLEIDKSETYSLK